MDNFPDLSANLLSSRAIRMSSVEIKPATDGRNDPASESCIRCDEKSGIFLSNKPDTNELRRVFFGGKKQTSPPSIGLANSQLFITLSRTPSYTLCRWQ